MKHIVLQAKTIVSSWLILAMLTLLFGPPFQVANAAALTDKSDTLSTIKASTASNQTILFTTPTGVAAGETIGLTLTSFSVAAGLDFEDLDLSEDATPDGVCDTGDTEKTLAASPSGATWGAVRTSATVITLTSGTGTIAAGSEVCIEVGTGAEQGATGVEQITSPAAGAYTLAIAGTMTDSGSVAIRIIADDQVDVSGTVSESITFSLSANSVSFGALSVSAATTGTHTFDVATNGAGGAVVTYSGSTLTSGGDTIAAMSSATTSSVGTEQFGINLKDNATPNVGAECSGSAPIAAAATGYATADNFKFVSGDTVASASNSINTSTCTISYLANIAGTTEPGTYETTLTYIASGTF